MTQSKRYSARIMVDRKEVYLGVYDTVEEAVNARESAEDQYFGDFAQHKYRKETSQMENGRELSLEIREPEAGNFLKRIEWNREEFKTLVESAMERYNGIAFTEEQMKEAKAERAELNALKKAISDKRVQVKNEIMAPYTRFENEVREITDLIDKPIAEIDRQIKAYEDNRKAEKRESLKRYFDKIAGDLESDGVLSFEKIFDSRYLNATVSLAKAKKDIESKIERVRADLRTVESVEDEYKVIIRDIYQKTLDIGAAMSEMYRLKDLKRKEEERKAREAAEKEAEKEFEQKNVENKTERPAAQVEQAVERPPVETDAASTGVTRNIPPAQDPFINPPKEKRYKASFTVYGSKNQILAVRQFMLENHIEFKKGVK